MKAYITDMCTVPVLLAREEEASFSKTLLKGIERFKKAAGAAQGGVLSGRDAFELWDTYGFPQDLTEVLHLLHLPIVCLLAQQVASYCAHAETCRPAPHKSIDRLTLCMQLMAEERGLKIESGGFEACMEEQRQRSRAAGKTGGGPALKFEAEATAHLQRSGVSVTNDSPKCAWASPSSLLDQHTKLRWRVTNASPNRGKCLGSMQAYFRGSEAEEV